jgi:hypothetical protein
MTRRPFALLALPALVLASLAFTAAPALAAGPEAPETVAPATGVTATTATLHGVLNPHTEATDGYYFAYNTNGECAGGPTSEPGGEAKVKARQEEANLTGLEPAKEYRFCLVATNALGQFTRGNEESFETAALAPSLTESSESASTATPFEETFAATLNANNEETTYAFEYSTEAKGENLEGSVETVAGAPVNGYGEQGVSASTGPVLKSATTYYYRVVAENAQSKKEGKPVIGPVEQFTTSTAQAPLVESEGVSGQSTTGARLEGAINPNYQATRYVFEYSTEAGGEPLVLKGTIVKVPGTLPAGSAGVPVSTSLTGLKTGETYYYRLVAENEASETAGTPATLPVQSFTTIGLYALTLTTTGTGTGTVISTPAAIDCGASCSADFEAHAQVTLSATPVAGSQFVGWSGGGCSGTEGCTVTITAQTAVTAEFRQPSPVVLTEAASTVTSSTANLAGEVSPQGAPTEACEFEYGPTPAYGSLAACVSNPGSGTAYAPVAATLEGLAGRTSYHYRLVARNAAGVTYGADMQFTTPESPAEVAAEAQAKQQAEAAAARKAQEEAAATAAAKAATEAKSAAEAKAAAEVKAAAEAKAKAEDKKQQEEVAAAAKKKKLAAAKAKKKKKQKKKKKAKHTKKGKKS